MNTNVISIIIVALALCGGSIIYYSITMIIITIIIQVCIGNSATANSSNRTEHGIQVEQQTTVPLI
jgi:hypothetical protein